MYAKDLIKILQKLPPDTLICKTDGDDGCEGLESAKYFPQFDILYLDPYWMRRSKGYIDMGSGYILPEIPEGEDYSKEELLDIRALAKKGKEIVDAKKDGKMHRIQVVKKEGVVMPCQDYSLRVDDEWISGDFRLGKSFVVCDFEWESINDEQDFFEENCAKKQGETK